MTKLSEQEISSVNKEIYHRYKEFSNVKPSVQKQGNHYLLTYKHVVRLPSGQSLSRYLRVTVDQQGSIIKIATSK